VGVADLNGRLSLFGLKRKGKQEEHDEKANRAWGKRSKKGYGDAYSQPEEGVQKGRTKKKVQ